ncbi:hypothetical protein Gpo141_00013773 [Globisporangium polare]
MVFASFKKIVVLAVLAAAAVSAATPNAPYYNEAGVYQIGTQEALNVTVAVGLSRDDVVSYPQASYVAVHFSGFNLPEGDLVVVRSPDSEVAHFYTGKGRDDREDFIASYIPGDTAIVQYFSASEGSSTNAAPSYTISGFSRGFPNAAHESICGADNTRPAKCFASGTLFNSLPLAYSKAQAVARLLIGGSGLCTGWLAGSEGHLITNQHCIETAADAKVIDIEFAAESASCADECTQQLGCKGVIAATTSTFITNSPISTGQDYALLKLPAAANIAAYKYLQLRASGPVLNERIYIPQHPGGKAKRISSVLDSGKDTYVESLSTSNSCGSGQVGYNADTEPGASGSPLIAASDNKVIALHHCGGCQNSAVNIKNVIADLKAKGITVNDLVA